MFARTRDEADLYGGQKFKKENPREFIYFLPPTIIQQSTADYLVNGLFLKKDASLNSVSNIAAAVYINISTATTYPTH